MCLGQIQIGINNTINSSTNKTAAEALFGVRFRDALSNKLDVELNDNPVNFKKLREEVNESIELNQQKQKHRYDSGRAPATVYKEGDLIKLTRTNYYTQGNSTKLLSKFVGPYRIVKILGNDRYKIGDIPGLKEKKRPFESVVAADRIRPWIQINSEDNVTDSDDDNVPLSELRQRT